MPRENDAGANWKKLLVGVQLGVVVGSRLGSSSRTAHGLLVWTTSSGDHAGGVSGRSKALPNEFVIRVSPIPCSCWTFDATSCTSCAVVFSESETANVAGVAVKSRDFLADVVGFPLLLRLCRVLPLFRFHSIVISRSTMEVCSLSNSFCSSSAFFTLGSTTVFTVCAVKAFPDFPIFPLVLLERTFVADLACFFLAVVDLRLPILLINAPTVSVKQKG